MRAAVEAPAEAPDDVRRRRRGIAGLDLVGHVALALVLVFALLAAFGPYLAPHDPDLVDLQRAYWGPDASHPLGYDHQGRDVLSRLLVGARTSFLGPLTIVVFATVAGTLLAVVSAWRRGWTDAALSGVLDASLAFPGILLAVMAVAVFGAGLQATVIALSIAYTPYMARIVRSAALREIGKDYVDSLRVQGFSAWRICRRHVLPNVMPIVLGQAALTLAWATIDLAGLSYLGLGIQPPSADWGVMVADGQAGVIAGYPMPAVVAGVSLVVAICSFALLGERLLRRAEVTAA
jgi:peptide/nickel transport system permease protein